LSLTFFRNSLFIFSFSLFYVATSSANDRDGINIEAAPDWVLHREMTTLDNFPIDEISNGIFYQMVDDQIQVAKSGEKTAHARYVETVVNKTGLDSNSQINIDFDPSYQKLVLNSLFLVRDGQQIDKLSSAKISIFNRETELENQIYNGSLTLNILISDLRVGDTLDYSYTTYGSNPVYQNIFSYRRNLNWGVPVFDQHIRILWGKTQPLYVETRNFKTPISKTEIGDYTEYQVNLHNAETLNTASQIPYWYDPYGSIYFNESKSWSDVVAWAEPLYKFDAIHPSVQKIANNIKLEHPERSTQIAAALKYTQDNIRYVGLEMGENSHLPTPPQETLALSYGDCKDKASLFIAILRALQIEAFPALVDTENTKLLIEEPPGVNLFNHVLVSLTYNEEQFWLDPTLSNQEGSLVNLYQPDYGYALVLKPGQNDLISMASEAVKSYKHISEKYFIPKNNEQKVAFSVATQYLGYKAIKQYEQLERDGKKKVSENYEIYYQRNYPSLTADSEISIATDNISGVLNIEETYSIADFWEKGDEHYEADFYPMDIRDAVFKPKQINRNAPLAFNYPNNIKVQTEIEFESDGWEFSDSKFVEDNDFFTFTSTVTFVDKTLLLSYDYSAKVDNIPEDKIETYLESRNKLRKEAYYGITKYIKNPETATSSDDDAYYLWFMIIGAIYLAGLLFIIVSWRLESSKRPTFSDAHFYPMSFWKFLTLSIASLGFYPAYWMYRNWQAVKLNSNADIMPIARGFFAPLWFYPIFSTLKNDSVERFKENKVLLPSIAAIFAFTYIALSILENISENVILASGFLILPLLFLPLIKYINSINVKENCAYEYNSRWHFRHIVTVILCIPLLALNIASETPFLPGDSIRTESEMLAGDLKFLYRQKILPVDEEINYFYSDAFFSMRSDGNGFTNNRVFSYWLDEQDIFQKEVVTFDKIKNIDVKYDKDPDNNTIITITRLDESDFLLFVSTVDGGDKVFVESLNLLWKNQQAPLNNAL
jgi:transglutaminase-like putative cysteine protease